MVFRRIGMCLRGGCVADQSYGRKWSPLPLCTWALQSYQVWEVMYWAGSYCQNIVWNALDIRAKVPCCQGSSWWYTSLCTIDPSASLHVNWWFTAGCILGGQYCHRPGMPVVCQEPRTIHVCCPLASCLTVYGIATYWVATHCPGQLNSGLCGLHCHDGLTALQQANTCTGVYCLQVQKWFLPFNTDLR